MAQASVRSLTAPDVSNVEPVFKKMAPLRVFFRFSVSTEPIGLKFFLLILQHVLHMCAKNFQLCFAVAHFVGVSRGVILELRAYVR